MNPPTQAEQAIYYQNEYFEEPFCDWLQYPDNCVNTVINDHMLANPGQIRTDATEGTNLFLRRRNSVSPIYCTLTALADADGMYTLLDEFGNTHKSLLQVADSVIPEHYAYSKITNMSKTDAKTMLYATLQRLYNARRRHGTDNQRGRRVVFRFMVHACMLFNRISRLHHNTGHPALKHEGTSLSITAHLLDILNEFFRTYKLYNRKLIEEGRQAMIQPTQDSVIEFVLASIGFRMGFGHDFKITKSENSLRRLEENPRTLQRYNVAEQFIHFVTHTFHPDYTESFKGHRNNALSMNMKTKRNELFGKKMHAITSAGNTDNVSTSSLHMYYPHYRACNALWSGFEQHYLNNAKNVLGQPSRANAFTPDDRHPALNEHDKHDFNSNTETLWYLFPNKKSRNLSCWM